MQEQRKFRPDDIEGSQVNEEIEGRMKGEIRNGKMKKRIVTDKLYVEIFQAEMKLCPGLVDKCWKTVERVKSRMNHSGMLSLYRRSFSTY